MKSEERKMGLSNNGQEMHYSVGVIVNFNDKYLLLDRVNPPPGFAGPGGHIDEDEEPLTAAIRELKEETGIVVENLEFIVEEEIHNNVCKMGVGVHYWYLYKVIVSNQNIDSDKSEAKSMSWYTVEEMKNLKLEEVWKYWFEKLKII